MSDFRVGQKVWVVSRYYLREGEVWDLQRKSGGVWVRLVPVAYGTVEDYAFKREMVFTDEAEAVSHYLKIKNISIESLREISE